MTRQRMVELLEIEKECVRRNACGECNRACHICDLLQDDTELHEMYEEVIALVKAQVPRVLTLEEIADLKYHDMVYVEFKHPRKEEYRALGGFVDQMYKDIDTAEIKAIDITLGVNEIAHCPMKLYLNDFRLWTFCPTAEQMNAVPWA